MLVYNYAIKSVKEYAAYDTLGKKLASWKVEENMVQPTYINCRNCGAPVKGYECEYCGTKY